MKTTSLITLFYLFNSAEAMKLSQYVKLAQTMEPELPDTMPTAANEPTLELEGKYCKE